MARSIGQETNDNLTLPGTGSQAASDPLSNKVPDQANGSVPSAFQVRHKRRPHDKAFGLGMAVVVGVGATIVRCFLVPVIMSLPGHASGWMPGWLERVTPAFSIEGKEFFAKLEAAEISCTTTEPPAPDEVQESAPESEEADKPVAEKPEEPEQRPLVV